eukprot:47700-Chlamydomonas_euryale.AAC.1
MERLSVAVCGLQEVRRSGTGERPLPNGWLILWAGGDKGQSLSSSPRCVLFAEGEDGCRVPAPPPRRSEQGSKL